MSYVLGIVLALIFGGLLLSQWHLARKLHVMATPTVILVADNRIASVNLGAMTERRLVELLE